MAKKLIGIVFALVMLLAARCLYAAPAESSEEISAGRVSLFLLILEYFMEMLSHAMKQIPDIFKLVLKDPQVLAINTKEMEGYLSDLNDCIEGSVKFSKSSNKDTAMDYGNKCMGILQKFNGDQQKLMPEAALIEKSLKENGLTEMENIIEDNFKLFLRKFNHHVDEYLSSLNRSQKRKEQELIDWVDKLNAEGQIEKQMEMFGEIFKEA